MTFFRFTVGYEGTIEAPDPDTARAWALEEVENNTWRPLVVEVEPETPKAEVLVACTCHGDDPEPYCPRHSKEPHEHA